MLYSTPKQKPGYCCGTAARVGVEYLTVARRNDSADDQSDLHLADCSD
jgi:hypothetical protein